MTVIEVTRRAAGLSQRRLAQIARTQQSSVSKYESRRKSPASGSGRLAPQPALDRGLVAAVARAVSERVTVTGDVVPETAVTLLALRPNE
jgi:transcriptional regulator with XRE-family HTH domain